MYPRKLKRVEQPVIWNGHAEAGDSAPAHTLHSSHTSQGVVGPLRREQPTGFPGEAWLVLGKEGVRREQVS